jgi:FixJ family two-component response regulator/anti-sigma regulatory factor (Ser/Thr protein kinase)
MDILIIDDNKKERDLLSRMIVGDHHRVRAVQRFQSYKNMDNRDRPMLVIVDEHLDNGVRGSALIENEMDKNPLHHYLIVTGKKDLDFVEEVSHLDRTYYLSKPINQFDLNFLTQKIINVMELQKLKEESESKLQRQLQSAENCLMSMLPQSQHCFKDTLLSWDMRSVNNVGGDFVYYSNQPENKILMAIGDISGHDLSSALFSSLILSHVKEISKNTEITPNELIHKLNTKVKEVLPSHIYLSLLVGVFDKNHNIMTLQNAGAENPYFIDKQKTIKQIAIEGGPPIGWMSDFDYLGVEPTYIPIKKGECVFACTDGLKTNHDLTTRSEEDVIRYVQKLNESKCLSSFDQEIADDTTFLSFQRTTEEVGMLQVEIDEQNVELVVDEIKKITKKLYLPKNLSKKILLVLVELYTNLCKYCDLSNKSHRNALFKISFESETEAEIAFGETCSDFSIEEDLEALKPTALKTSGMGSYIIKSLTKKFEQLSKKNLTILRVTF